MISSRPPSPGFPFLARLPRVFCPPCHDPDASFLSVRRRPGCGISLYLTRKALLFLAGERWRASFLTSLIGHNSSGADTASAGSLHGCPRVAVSAERVSRPSCRRAFEAGLCEPEPRCWLGLRLWLGHGEARCSVRACCAFGRFMLLLAHAHGLWCVYAETVASVA